MRYHSRHIPEELLNLDAPMGAEVKRNGLCDTLEGDTPARLRDCGVTVIETRLVWWECEPQPGRFDFSRLERDLDKIERAGFRAGVFPWFQHPPAWYDIDHTRHARFQCLEHRHDSSILSLWDPRTLEVYERLYGELTHRFGKRLAFLYAGISGDFGEVAYPSGVQHYRFSPPHNHVGFWCGDRLSRASFKATLETRYGTLDRLNRAWGTRFDNWDADLMPLLPIERNPFPFRRDFARWYTQSLGDFMDSACGIVRRHFPDTEIGVPLGFPDESLAIGQIKSLAAKVAAKHRMMARWTGMGYLGSFPRSNVLARRFASAAQFYGAPFGTEAALTLTEENAANALYEAVANGASIIHDDPGNILRAEALHRRLRPGLFVSPPVCHAAVLYPIESEQLGLNSFNIGQFIDRAAALRQACDYHLCDSPMIRDGFLSRIEDLLVLVPSAVPQHAVVDVASFIERGGRVWLCGDADLSVVADTGEVSAFPDAIARKSQRAPTWPVLEPHASLDARHGRDVFYTVHDDAITQFVPNRGAIKTLPPASKADGSQLAGCYDLGSKEEQEGQRACDSQGAGDEEDWAPPEFAFCRLEHVHDHAGELRPDEIPKAERHNRYKGLCRGANVRGRHSVNEHLANKEEERIADPVERERRDHEPKWPHDRKDDVP